MNFQKKNKPIRLLQTVCVVCLAFFFCQSCVEESFIHSSDAKLDFSTDTVCFDTVFATIPTVTLEFRVYNKNSKAVVVDRIWLKGGEQSLFRFNVDGYSAKTNELKDLTISAGDSMFVFIETTLKESGEANPVYTVDELMFESNGNTQAITLEAYGQDAVILKGYSLRDNETFTAEKPYLIFDFLHIPRGKTLTVEAGAKLYFHKSKSKMLATQSGQVQLDNTSIVVEGDIKLQGTYSNRITLRGDRFDLAYTNVLYSYMPSQWGGIYLLGENGHNEIVCADIVGAENALQLFGGASLKIPLELSNSTIHCSGGYGIYALYGKMKIWNTEISNCGKSCILQMGGDMQLTHSTLANYLPAYLNGGQARKEPALNIVSYMEANENIVAYPIGSAVVENSIIFGNQQIELGLRDTTLGIPFNIFISDCLIKSKPIERAELLNILWSKDGVNDVFVQPSSDFDNIDESGYFDFSLSEGSMAIGKANKKVSELYPQDILGRNRLKDVHPDLGAYEK